MLVSPYTRAVEVHVGEMLPAPACAYQCKTNGGKTLVPNAKTLKNMFVIEIEVLDVYVVHFGPCLWWNLAQWVTETMQPPNRVG